MIDYSETRVGDTLRITGMGAPGFAALGELVEVVGVSKALVTVRNARGRTADFVLTCGAQRLERVEP